VSDQVDVWKTLSKYCIEHRETGHRVCKVILSDVPHYEPWFKQGGKYVRGGMSTDPEQAKRWAINGSVDEQE